METKKAKKEGYLGQNDIGPILETVRVLIERLCSRLQPTEALVEVLTRKISLNPPDIRKQFYWSHLERCRQSLLLISQPMLAFL